MNVAAAQLLMTVNAIKITENREPLMTWAPSAKKSPHPVDYVVPNFGMDNDVKNTAVDLAVAENSLGHKWNLDPNAKKAKGPPVDYFVPNFGQDHEIATTLQNEQQASKNLGHKWVVTAKKDLPPPHPTDYFVPNFGMDNDVKNTAVDLAVAENALGHKWNLDPNAKKAKGPPVDYFVPNFGVDHDIKDSLAHLDKQESIHGKWNIADVQLDAETEREPLLSWAPTVKKGFPKNYFVPNFGKDHDIDISQTNESAAESKLGHKWEPKIDPETEKYVVPSPQIEFKLLQTEAETEAENKREPLLTWAPTIPKTHPMNYFVPNFGLDHEIIASQDDLKN